MNRVIYLQKKPRRIVSLVPSQTELLHYFGLTDEVVGITKFCVHPDEWYKNKTRIGGTKSYHFDKIKQLQPDLIIGNKEENDQSQINELAQNYSVWMSDIKTIGDAYEMIIQLGELVSREIKAQVLVQNIQQSFQRLSFQVPIKAAYFIWQKPYMIAANDTFIHEMMKEAGFENVFKDQTRYPAIDLNELAKLSPEVILLSSEPFPFQEKHFPAFRVACPNAKIMVVDGELFSWYGSRLLASAEYFKKLQKLLKGIIKR